MEQIDRPTTYMRCTVGLLIILATAVLVLAPPAAAGAKQSVRAPRRVVRRKLSPGPLRAPERGRGDNPVQLRQYSGHDIRDCIHSCDPQQYENPRRRHGDADHEAGGRL